LPQVACVAHALSGATRAKSEIRKNNRVYSQAVPDLCIGGARPTRRWRTAASAYRWGLRARIDRCTLFGVAVAL